MPYLANYQFTNISDEIFVGEFVFVQAVLNLDHYDK